MRRTLPLGVVLGCAACAGTKAPAPPAPPAEAVRFVAERQALWLRGADAREELAASLAAHAGDPQAAWLLLSVAVEARRVEDAKAALARFEALAPGSTEARYAGAVVQRLEAWPDASFWPIVFQSWLEVGAPALHESSRVAPAAMPEPWLDEARLPRTPEGFLDAVMAQAPKERRVERALRDVGDDTPPLVRWAAAKELASSDAADAAARRRALLAALAAERPDDAVVALELLLADGSAPPLDALERAVALPAWEPRYAELLALGRTRTAAHGVRSPFPAFMLAIDAGLTISNDLARTVAAAPPADAALRGRYAAAIDRAAARSGAGSTVLEAMTASAARGVARELRGEARAPEPARDALRADLAVTAAALPSLLALGGPAVQDAVLSEAYADELRFHRALAAQLRELRAP